MRKPSFKLCVGVVLTSLPLPFKCCKVSLALDHDYLYCSRGCGCFQFLIVQSAFGLTHFSPIVIYSIGYFSQTHKSILFFISKNNDIKLDNKFVGQLQKGLLQLCSNRYDKKSLAATFTSSHRKKKKYIAIQISRDERDADASCDSISIS